MSLYNTGVLKFGRFRLSSGKISNYYIDVRIIPTSPSLYSKVITAYLSTVKRFGSGNFDCVVGVATAGLLFSIPVSLKLGVPMSYVRTNTKGHGTKRKLEGRIEKGSRAIVLDDIATTGGSILKAVEEVSSLQGEVVAAFVFVDREEGAEENLLKAGVRLYSCFKVSEIFETLHRKGLFKKEI